MKMYYIPCYSILLPLYGELLSTGSVFSQVLTSGALRLLIVWQKL